jgi:hypothetical protein
MSETTENAKRIREIDAILESGVSSVVVDGRTVTYDLDSLRKERRRLSDADATLRSKRPVASPIRLGGF